MQGIVKSKKLMTVMVIIGFFLIILASFSIGVTVGLRKARFSYDFGENYERNFIGPRPMDPRGPMGMMPFNPDFEGKGFRNGHGVAGTIISISDGSIVIKDRGDKENTITISDKTVINRGRDTIKIGDMKNDEEVVVIGKPEDNGAINADLIRVFDKNISNNK
jgi:hypothetical protein